MKKALVLGGGDDQRALIMELCSRGYLVSLLDYHSDPPAKDLACKHYQVSTLDVEQVLDVARSDKFDLVTTACIDQAILTVAYVCEEMGLRAPLNYEKALCVTNKAYMKRAFRNNGIPTSKFVILESYDDLFGMDKLSFPLVVKPADSNGSYGIRKAMNDDELSSAIKMAFKISRSKKVIVEEFISGNELSIDAFIIKGVAEIVLITKSMKIPTKENVFPILQSRYPVDLPTATTSRVRQIVQGIADVFQIDNTPLLVQILEKDEELFTLEFGVRIAGGSKHHLIKHITGFDVMKVYVDSLFARISKIKVLPVKRCVSMNYIYANLGNFAGIRNSNTLIKSGIMVALYQYKKLGMSFMGSDASRDRAGSFLVDADSLSEMWAKIREIDMNLQVIDPNGCDLMIHGLYDLI